MKTGILTICHTLNYGAELQAYALQRVIEKLGYNVEVIDYRNKLIADRESAHLPNIKRVIRHPVLSLYQTIGLPDRQQREREFKEFNSEYIRSSPPYLRLVEFADKYDAVIVGSDQVWNMECTGNDLTFFLVGGIEDRVNKIAYAASFGGCSFPVAYTETCGRALRSFSRIGVREDAGTGIVRSLCNREAVVVLDPTLLLEKSEWEQLARSSSVADRDYIFVYIVSEREKTLWYARTLAKKMRCDLIVIDCYGGPRIFDRAEFWQSAGPQDFLGLIKNARGVVTSSFHGLALSLVLNKDVYYSLDRKLSNANRRLQHLAEMTCITSHAITDDMVERPIDFDVVNRNIAAAKEESIRFLSDALRK